MKKKMFFTILLFLAVSLKAEDNNYSRAQFMSLKDAEKRWGVVKFDPEKFKKLSPRERASMAVYTAKNQLYKGRILIEVREELGEPDGYFFSDTILAYQIEPYTEEKKESWQLVFIPDEKNIKKVGRIQIHKKCCYNESFK